MCASSWASGGRTLVCENRRVRPVIDHGQCERVVVSHHAPQPPHGIPPEQLRLCCNQCSAQPCSAQPHNQTPCSATCMRSARDEQPKTNAD
jgi:hypothetical protein